MAKKKTLIDVLIDTAKKQENKVVKSEMVNRHYNSATEKEKEKIDKIIALICGHTFSGLELQVTKHY